MPDDGVAGVAMGQSAGNGVRCSGNVRLAVYEAFAERHRCASGSTSVAALEIARFDEEVRLLLLRGIQAIELKLKEQYSRVMREAYGKECLHNACLFRRRGLWRQSMKAMQVDVRRRMAVQNAGGQMRDPSEPVSVDRAIDCSTLATVVRFYTNTRDVNVRQRVADSFSVNHRCLESWLTALLDVRNACAHFEPFSVLPCLPQTPKPIIGQEGDPTSPLYALALVERLLGGGLRGFEEEASVLAGGFAWCSPDLAVALRMPIGVVWRYASRHLPEVSWTQMPSMIAYAWVERDGVLCVAA